MIRVGQRYGKIDLDGPWDAIVIGSGIGGLASAALLAKHADKRVLVLERHYMPGGFTHVYSRHGYEWDVGLHYIGDVHRPESSTRRLFDHVTDGSLDWAAMADVYDRIILDGEAFDLTAGRDAFRATLGDYFPAERDAIADYTDLIQKVARQVSSFYAEKAVPAPIAAIAGRWMRRPLLKWSRRTTREVLQELTDDAQLIGVLTGQWGDYGLPPGQSSFAMHAVVANHYLNGGAYPLGGSSSIAAAMAPLIEATGGQIVYQADVEEILVDDKTATGVRLVDGVEIEAPIVISDAGVHNTFLRLLPDDVAASTGLQARAQTISPSVGHLCLYAGFRKTAAELGLETTNLWIYPGADHDANVERYVADTSRTLPLVYASFPAAKDPRYEELHPGRATIELITLASFDEFEPWRGTGWRRRGDEYEALKESYGKRMLSALETQCPGLAAEIDYQEISTPLSTRYFANYESGEIYGVDHSPARFEQRWLKPRTPVRGLYLTGQDIVTCGVTAALVAGYLTSTAILRRNLMNQALER